MFPILEQKFIPIFVVLLIWASVWKAYALWKSARNGHKYWFAAIFLLNTLGILEIVYLLLKRKGSKAG